ncbi:MAG: hypothetical protein HY611_06775 [Elusimicrobia bacterium]|nr:hypothetical protein [Elusimicrobiota bacterium]
MIDREGIDIVGAPADHVQIVIRDAASHETYCKGPGTDVATTSSGGVSLGVAGPPVVGGQESVGENSGRGALSLGGRAPVVLLARELFYRTCELTLNANLGKADAVGVYKMTLDAVERIAAVQTGGGSAAASAAPPAAVAGLPFLTGANQVVKSTDTAKTDDDDDDDD